MAETVWWSEVDSDYGVFGVASTERGLLALFLPRETPDHLKTIQHLTGGYTLVPDDGHNAEAERQLREYLAGERKTFDITLDQRGTAFQLQVWNAVYDVPWGTTLSYGDIARQIGNPKAVRAVGAANGANPHPVIVPCHRIVGSNGTLTGYGGGLQLKRQLLALEGIPVAELPAYRTLGLFGE